VRVIISGGEAVDQTLIDRTTDLFENAVLHEGYGQTEAPALVGDCTALGVEHREGRMGKEAIGQRIDVLDPESGEPVDVGKVGEICLEYGHPCYFERYLDLPEVTDRTIRDGYLHTDDLARIDDDGYFAYHSRKDHVIISSGYRIAPQEIEAALAKHESVHDAGVVGVPDEIRGEIPKAFVVLEGGYEPGDDLAEELQATVKDTLAKYEYPREVEFVDDLPQTHSGKIRRQDLETL
jgi:acetyl-CoA synthetase